MKKHILLCLLPLAVFAAAPVVNIADDANVYVDGVNVGSPAATIANRPELAATIEAALRTHHAKVQADAAAQITAAQKASADAIAANAKELAATKQSVAKLTPQLAEAKQQLSVSADYIAKLQKALRDAGQPVPKP